MYKIILPCAKGTEQVLQAEADTLGLQNSKIGVAVVSGEGDELTAYRLCLWSRVASRVLLVLTEYDMASPEDLYAGAYTIDWTEHLSADTRFAIRFSGTGQGIRNTQFGALKVKDAVVDRLREYYKRRPDVDTDNPDIRIDAHLQRGRVTLALDVSGGALHERGYRQWQGKAPIRETLAAAMLYRGKWHEQAQAKKTLIDPMCGAGTLLLEALMMAADIAPGLKRQKFGFEQWQQHRPSHWRQLLGEAQARAEKGLKHFSHKFYGFDSDAQVLAAARKNAESAGLAKYIHFETRAVERFRFEKAYGEAGFIVSNPPYGERLGEITDLVPLYAHIGQAFKTFPDDWTMTLIASNEALLKRLKLRAQRQYQIFNGALEGKILLYERAQQPEDAQEIREAVLEDAPSALSEVAQMFANRLQKNLGKLKKWAANVPTNAYRIYDKDLPEYAFAIDVYGEHLLVQEYAAPKEIPKEKAQQRLFDVLQALPVASGFAPENIVLKTRERQSGNKQYEKLGDSEQRLMVQEGRANFLVNLRDYLDVGLFLDHRPMRLMLAKEAQGKRFLNLFCYTASASVHAALGGARYSTSVDLSGKYLDWAQDNFHLNALGSEHRLVKADVMEWLAKGQDQYDLIFCDPPTFSNTKKENRLFDVQKHHVALIELAMQRLAKDGILYFSNNYRGFKLDEAALAAFQLKEISTATIDKDFERNPRIHRVWKIRHQ